jgi:hypothetical protein
MSTRRSRWLLLVALPLALLACDRPGTPPKPTAPIHPQTMAPGKAMRIRPAIFNYDVPCGKTTHSTHPQPAKTACFRLQV